MMRESFKTPFILLTKQRPRTHKSAGRRVPRGRGVSTGAFETQKSGPLAVGVQPTRLRNRRISRIRGIPYAFGGDANGVLVFTAINADNPA